jgi:hypothetical protein
MVQRIGKSLVCTVVCGVIALPALAGSHSEAKPADHSQHGHQAAAGAPSEDAMMQAMVAAATPGAEHARLAESTGTWKATVRMWMGPGEPTVSEATAKNEMILGGRVLAQTFEGNMMGEPFTGHGMIGYDNSQKVFWSTWNDTMSTGIMTTTGKWDEAAQGIVMEGEMTDPVTGQPGKVKTVSRFPEPGKELFEMWQPVGPGGEMIRIMEITMVKQ